MMITLNCPKCSKPHPVEAYPMKFMQLQTSCVVVQEHSDQFVCVCGETLKPVVLQVQGVVMGLLPVPEDQKKKQIIQPTKGLIEL